MVFANKYTKDLLKTFPGFKDSKSLSDALAVYSQNDCVGLHCVFQALAIYVAEESPSKYSNVTPEEVNVFKYIEDILVKFDNSSENTEEYDFNNAACVSFLETLLNYASWEQTLYQRFIPLLGSKSKEFCRSWDKFTGIRSPGLWEDDKWNESKI